MNSLIESNLCSIYTEPCNMGTLLAFDNLTNNYIYNINKVIPADEHLSNHALYITYKGKIIASNDTRVNVSKVHNDLIQEFCSLNGFKNILVRMSKRVGDNDWSPVLDDDGNVIVHKFKETYTVQELLDIATAYPNDAQFGAYIKEELLKQ